MHAVSNYKTAKDGRAYPTRVRRFAEVYVFLNIIPNEINKPLALLIPSPEQQAFHLGTVVVEGSYSIV
ncbi:hypothetical protein, partial [Pseudomonas helleri]|uniref:hypothetical protein n=1 Tax=Pseudomonas helleri TaxID=1608996 RepID=UPI001E4826AD